MPRNTASTLSELFRAAATRCRRTSSHPRGGALDLAALKTELGQDTQQETKQATKQDTELRDLMWGDVAADMPHFGIYGKLGDNKGSFALLAAMARLKRDGVNVGLVALAHGRPDIERRFRERVGELGLTGRVLQIPFLPHWRVPEFVRGCLAVCCLEQDFPISVHSPIVPFEVLLCGSCLVASTEVIRKLPQWERLPHGYGCVAIKDVNDVEELSGKLAAIVREPRLTAAVGSRGRRFAQDCQEDAEFPERLEAILMAAAARQPLPSGLSSQVLPDEAEPDAGRFPLTQIVATALPGIDAMPTDRVDDLARAQRILAALQEGIAGGRSDLCPLARAVRVEIAVAQAEDECPQGDDATDDPLFRLGLRRWALEAGELGELLPVRHGHTRVLQFDHDIAAYRSVKTLADFPHRQKRSQVIWPCSVTARSGARCWSTGTRRESSSSAMARERPVESRSSWTGSSRTRTIPIISSGSRSCSCPAWSDSAARVSGCELRHTRRLNQKLNCCDIDAFLSERPLNKPILLTIHRGVVC